MSSVSQFPEGVEQHLGRGGLSLSVNWLPARKTKRDMCSPSAWIWLHPSSPLHILTADICLFFFFLMSVLATVDTNFPSGSVYLNVYTFVHLLDFWLSVFLPWEMTSRQDISDMITKNTFGKTQFLLFSKFLFYKQGLQPDSGSGPCLWMETVMQDQ